MHLVVECKRRDVALEVLESWRGVWISILRAAAAKASCDLFERRYGGTHKGNESVWQTDASMVRKSVSRYLSKYQSKECSEDKKYYPPRWYGVSSSLRRRLKGFVAENVSVVTDRISPDAGVRAARVVIESLLKEFCVGEVTHKHGYGESDGVDCFGYLRENTEFSQVCHFVHGMVAHLGLSVQRLKGRLKMVDVGRECERMSRAIESEMPPEMFASYMQLLTPTLWSRFSDRNIAQINEYRQGYWAYTFLTAREGYGWNNQPEWVSALNQDWSRSRERFGQILPE